MPIYEFQCTKCRHLFEEFFTKLPERPSAKCPECGGKGKKVISNVGIVFKGAGFYVTDSRTSPAQTSAPAPATTPAAAGGGAGSEAGSGGGDASPKSKPKDAGSGTAAAAADSD